MNKTKYLIIISVVLILLAGGVFGYKYFSGTSATKIEIQNEVAVSEVQGPTSESPIDTPRSDLEDAESLMDTPRSNLSQESNSKDSTSESSKDTPRLNLSDDIDITNKFVSWGFEKVSSRKIDTVIIHSSYNSLGGDEFSLSRILDIYKSYGVAPHYIIDRGGKIYRLVEDKNIAYHAGESKVPDGRTGVNSFSIGIEIINSKTEKPTSDQYAALKNLVAQLKSEYKIKYVLGHNQIAPGRKDDPWNFAWNKI